MGGVGSGRKPDVGKRAKRTHDVMGKSHAPRRSVLSTGVSADEHKALMEACETRGISTSSGIRLLIAYASQGFTDWRALDAPGLQEQFGGGFRHLTKEEREAIWAKQAKETR